LQTKSFVLDKVVFCVTNRSYNYWVIPFFKCYHSGNSFGEIF